MNINQTTGCAILALGIALGGFFPGYFYYSTVHNNRTVTVKGLSEMEVKADLAFWKIKFKTTGNDLNSTKNGFRFTGHPKIFKRTRIR